jgi:hypothetical protein
MQFFNFPDYPEHGGARSVGLMRLLLSGSRQVLRRRSLPAGDSSDFRSFTDFDSHTEGRRTGCPLRGARATRETVLET